MKEILSIASYKGYPKSVPPHFGSQTLSGIIYFKSSLCTIND
jgi:hypothetical protein